jgi:hypothetical protein
MWTFVETDHIENQWGSWTALVVLNDGYNREAFWINFSSEPSVAEADAAGVQMAVSKNVAAAEAEFEAVVGNPYSALNLQWQTTEELAARFRARYAGASGIDAAKLAYWLIERVIASDLTDAQMEVAFGLTPTEYNSVAARISALHDSWANVLAAHGE